MISILHFLDPSERQTLFWTDRCFRTGTTRCHAHRQPSPLDIANSDIGAVNGREPNHEGKKRSMSEKHPECPLYNPLNCKEYYNPKLCAFVRKDKVCLKKKKPKAKAKK